MDTTLIDRLIENSGPTKPGGFYSPEGDCVFFFLDDGPHRGHRIDGLLTTYRREGDSGIVGFQVKGIRSFLNEARAAVKMAGDELELRVLLMAAFKRAQQDPPKLGSTLEFDRITTYLEAILVSDRNAISLSELEAR